MCPNFFRNLQQISHENFAFVISDSENIMFLFAITAAGIVLCGS